MTTTNDTQTTQTNCCLCTQDMTPDAHGDWITCPNAKDVCIDCCPCCGDDQTPTTPLGGRYSMTTLAAITSDMSITLGDGTTLHDTTDLGLARQWAEHEYGPERWETLTIFERSAAVADARAALHAALTA